MSLVIFSHTDYSYLWPIIEECMQPLSALNPIFVCNKTEMRKPTGFVKYIEYDETTSYAKRWTNNVLPHIDSKYILVVHDVSIIVNCVTEPIYKIFQLMLENNIDRCSLNVFNGNNVIEKYGIKLCNLNSARGNTLTPYDVCPAIWKTASFKLLLESFPDETYKTSELNESLQSFCTKKFNCFGLQKTSEKIYYCSGRPYLIFFKILHLTIKGELTFPPEVYMDMQTNFAYFFEKYKLSEKIKINNNYQFVLNNFRCI